MAFGNGLSLSIVVFGTICYCILFIMSIIGNTWIIIVTCQKTIKLRIFNHFGWLVANLAFADLLFTLLTIFNVVQHWPGGNNTCKFHGFLIEATYTTSISTLVVISYQRLKAVIEPFHARFSRWTTMKFSKLAIIWGLCFAVCSPLVFIYRLKTKKNGQVFCVTTAWGNIGPQIYYSFHGAIFFVSPLVYMIVTLKKINRALLRRVVPMRSIVAEQTNRRHRKVVRILTALTIAFVICWSPFMITRTLIYFHLASPGVAWRASQLLICVNPALDPLLYGYYGGNLKTVLRRVLRCHFSQRQEHTDVACMTVFQANRSAR